MADSLNKTMGLTRFIVSLIYRLTVRLTVEFLKIGTLLAILVVAGAVVGMAFMSLVMWSYNYYGGSIPAAACGFFFGLVLAVAATFMLDFIVREMLHLTDLPLFELFKLFISVMLGRKAKDVTVRVDERLLPSETPEPECDEEDKKFS